MIILVLILFVSAIFWVLLPFLAMTTREENKQKRLAEEKAEREAAEQREWREKVLAELAAKSER